jgi:hypothetical protein
MQLRCNYFGGANDVLPIYNNNIEIIWDVQFTCLDDLYYDRWPNINMPHGIINYFNTK